MARGYLNRPELTAEKFINNPFSSDPQARLYKTGDLARYLPDGTIEFIGRIDHQVKLRGFRIELGEIEAVLDTYPGIHKAIVSVREDQPGDKRLVAYVTYSTLEIPTLETLQRFLKEKLPEYMLPSAFVFLDSLPLTPNGKLDRNALPAPDLTRPEFAQTYVAPRSPTEEILVAIWQDVLAIERIGVQDNFFELGGYSLLILVLCTKIEAKIGKSIPISLIFQFPTISQLAVKLEQDNHMDVKAFDPIVTAFEIDSILPPLFWGFNMGSDAAKILKQLNNDRSFYLLNHQSLDSKLAKHHTIEAMANYYLQEILRIAPEGPYYLIGFSVGGVIMYEVAYQLCQQGKKVALLFLLDPSLITFEKKVIPAQNKIYNKIKREGYMSFVEACITFAKERLFFSLLVKIIVCIKKIPPRFHWRYISRIYMAAIQRYQPRSLPQDIETTVMVHTNTRNVQGWVDLFNDKVNIYSVDCNHEELISDPQYNAIWLDIMNSYLMDSIIN